MNKTRTIFSFILFIQAILVIPLHAQYTSILDVNFEQGLIDLGIDSEGILDGRILTADATSQTTLDLSGLDISDFTGIEAFTNLNELFCNDNPLNSLNISNQSSLTKLECSNTQLSTLDISNNTALVRLVCSDNMLMTLDLSNNSNLEQLYCQSNEIPSIDFTNTTDLKQLNIAHNELLSLDISLLTQLDFLECNNCTLNSIDVTNNTVLTRLSCSDNFFTSIDVSQNTALTELSCDQNSLTSLDVSNNTSLVGLEFSSNQSITSIDVSMLLNLTSLFCCDTDLTALDVSANTELVTLICGSVCITSLDLTNNTKLETVECHNINQLTHLDIRNGNNMNIPSGSFIANENPLLSCISVDDETWSTNNWPDIDMGTIFSNDCSLLPIELLSFTAKLTTESILLEWETVSESENKGFEIEHSTDFERWEMLDFIEGNGTTTQISNYEYEHQNPHFGMNYYRLKQIDFDNSSQYSEIVNIHFERENSVQLFPNPTNGLLEIDGLNIENIQVKIRNTTGKVVFEKAIKNEVLDISELSSGVYFFEFNIDNQFFVHKILKN